MYVCICTVMAGDITGLQVADRRDALKQDPSLAGARGLNLAVTKCEGDHPNPYTECTYTNSR